jgi:D-glycero-alpha-D-manno-heptose-7-phosphate kinase
MLDSSITNKSIDRLHEAAMSEGALGGKILGAGGGGYLLFFVPFHRRRAVAEILEELGGQVVDFGFDLRGLQLWKGRIRGNGLA